jgi:hypothetical protein
MLWNAIEQAALLNADTHSGTQFCSSAATTLVAKKKKNDGVMLALIAIEGQIGSGIGPYADHLPDTYLGKIVFDGLKRMSPCEP